MDPGGGVPLGDGEYRSEGGGLGDALDVKRLATGVELADGGTSLGWSFGIVEGWYGGAGWDCGMGLGEEWASRRRLPSPLLRPREFAWFLVGESVAVSALPPRGGVGVGGTRGDVVVVRYVLHQYMRG